MEKKKNKEWKRKSTTFFKSIRKIKEGRKRVRGRRLVWFIYVSSREGYELSNE
jgi:hypothetical protein